jgi:carboxyl-terminal processing protease
MKKALLILLLLLSANTGFSQIEPKDKLKIFNQVWETINDKYYDEKFNGTDWKQIRIDYLPKVENAKNDEEFYQVVKQMTRELRDAHTRFWTPEEAKLRRKKQHSSIGIKVEENGEKLVITGVETDSEADKAGVKIGMFVVAVDGTDVKTKLAEAKESIKSSSPQAVKLLSLRAIFRGEIGSTIKLTFTDKTNKTFDVALTRNIISESFEVTTKILPDNIGYLRFDTFNEKLSDKFKEALTNLKNTKGLIIDLRDNGGGQLNFVEKVAAWLLPEKTSFGEVQRREKGDKKLSFGDKDKQIYSTPIVVLIDNDSASGSELLSIGLQEAGRAKIVGSISCGCLLGISGSKKIGDGELELSQLGFISAKNYRVEENGVKPDKIVDVKLEDIQNGVDRALEEALKMLQIR